MGTRKNRLAEAILMSTRNLCFEQKYETYLRFFSDIFQFLKVKFSTYLHRHVFVLLLELLFLNRVIDRRHHTSKLFDELLSHQA